MNPPLFTGLAGVRLLLAALALLFLPAVLGEPASSAPSRAKSLRTLLAVPAVPSRRPPAGEVLSQDVFWTDGLDRSPAAGFSELHVKRWQLKARSSRLVSLDPGCGRLSNRLASFSDGTRACLRYGINPDQVLGETLSFYLSRLLGIRNVPALALSRVNTNVEQWLGVRRDVQDSQWSDKPIVSLTEWISNLSDVVTPPSLRTEGRTLYPSLEDLDNVTNRELMELVQWSDLILFDYVTANFDRLASSLLNLQWDSRVMERSTNNLHRTAKGALVFIDNEAGLVHGYRVLPMWDRYHESLLKTICIFRKETARKIAELHKSQNVAQQLLDLYRVNEPLASQMGFLSEEHAQMLQNRTDRLYKHILQCKAKYSK
ncbi:four-jointed box protein 1 [Chiloscyllium plagiosum]|uniref:four-jointed box protein 1 n=1 Tax=Chiloscyllium plagiosum TaxID=36176 RepID=UPI001CB8092D|nr:four-jointed box protein 1 [Chiloscyllium plagiosum]